VMPTFRRASDIPIGFARKVGDAGKRSQIVRSA
jgi:hypothetical protein